MPPRRLTLTLILTLSLSLTLSVSLSLSLTLSLSLARYVIADFANVIAGPACGRMFAELGATVYKLGPGIPQHGLTPTLALALALALSQP